MMARDTSDIDHSLQCTSFDGYCILYITYQLTVTRSICVYGIIDTNLYMT